PSVAAPWAGSRASESSTPAVRPGRASTPPGASPPVQTRSPPDSGCCARPAASEREVGRAPAGRGVRFPRASPRHPDRALRDRTPQEGRKASPPPASDAVRAGEGCGTPIAAFLLSAMDILLTGATGFVASHLYPALVERGHSVTCTSRDPAKAARRWPGRSWAHLDLADSRSLRAALRGRDAAFYLVHGMGSGPDYPRHEAEAARTFVEAAEAANLERVIYLGGMAPSGPPSRHL